MCVESGHCELCCERLFVLSGVAVDCWQSFDVPSARPGPVCFPSNPGACTVYL